MGCQSGLACHGGHDAGGYCFAAQFMAAPARAIEQKSADCGGIVDFAESYKMNLYLALKWLHVLSSVLMVGAGFGSAFYMFFTNRSGNLAAQAVVSRLVVRADWWFTTPTIIIQPITGFAMAHLAGFPLGTPWLMAAFGLYLFAGACWLPVVWLQIQMAAMAKTSLQTGTALPAVYWRYAKYWECLGYPAFLAMLVVFYLMLAKPG